MIATTFLLIIVLLSSSTGKRLCDNRQVTDVAKFLAALLVVNGHLFAYNVGGEWACELSLCCINLCYLVLNICSSFLKSQWKRL